MKKAVLLLSLFSVLAAMSYAAAPLAIDKQWERLMNVVSTEDQVRDFATTKDGQYVVSINRVTSALKVYSGFTGLQKVRIEDVATTLPTNYRFINGGFSDDGGLFVCSLSVVAGYRLFYWPTIDSQPREITIPRVATTRWGDALDVTGSVAANTVKVIVSGNVVGAIPTVYTTADGGATWSMVELANPIQAVDISFDPVDGSLWAASGAAGDKVRNFDSTTGAPLAPAIAGTGFEYAVRADNRGYLYTLGIRTTATVRDTLRVWNKATGALLLESPDRIDAATWTGVGNGSACIDIFYSAAGVPNILALTERSGAARYYVGSQVTVDGVGAAYPAYATIQGAIDTYAAGGANTTATQPLIISIDPRGGTPYDEVLTLQDTIVGSGDIVGDLVMKSSDPTSNPIILVRLRPSTTDDGFYVYQNVNDVTFKGLTFAPSLAAPPIDDTLKIDESSANTTMNWYSMIDCIITEVDLGGAPMITAKSQALNTPPAPGRVTGIAAGDEHIKCWGDTGESKSYWLENSVSYYTPGAGFLTATSGIAGEEVFINNSMTAYSRFDNTASALGFRVWADAGAGPDYHRISGTDAGQGPFNCTAALFTGWHGVYSPSALAVGSIIKIDNLLTYSSAAYDTNGDNRAYSGGAGASLALLQDSILNPRSVGVVDTLQNPAAYPAVWNRVTIRNGTNALLGVGTVTSPNPRTFNNCIFAGPGTKIAAAVGEFIIANNCGFPTSGPDAIGAVGAVTTNTLSVSANPIFAGYDYSQPNFFDVRSGAYFQKGTGPSNLAGGADYIGDAADGVPIIITEIIDGPLTGGLPKFVELTNIGSTPVDLATLDLVMAANGSATFGNRQQMVGSLAAGDSYVFASENVTFTATYGFAADQTGTAASHNGNDVVAVVLTGTSGVVDVYGQLGVDGTGTNWEILDSRAYRKSGAAPTYTFDVNQWVANEPNDNDGDTAAMVVASTSPGRFDNNMVFASQIGTGADLDDPTVPALTFVPSAADLLTTYALAFTAPVRGLHVSATNGLAVLTDGVDVGANGLDGLLFDANGDGIPSGLEVDLTSLSPNGVNISQINSWSRNGGKDARVYQNIHIYLDTTNDATFNPTFYGEVTTGGRLAVNSTEDWTAAYITDGRGNLGGAPVFGVRLDYFSVTNAGTGYRAEGLGGGGSIVKEIDIFGTPIFPPTSVPDWTVFD